MKKVALVFVVAVLAPSLVLAWLALRSLRDQQFLLERQQSLLEQRVTDGLAQDISDYLAQQQRDFSAAVEALAAGGDARALAGKFDDELRARWPLAEVGFCVTASGKILAPQPNARPEAQMFRLDNSGFLGNREPVEVYLNGFGNGNYANEGNSGYGSSLSGNRSAPSPAWQRQQAQDKAQPSAVASTLDAPAASQAFALANRAGEGAGGMAAGGGVAGTESATTTLAYNDAAAKDAPKFGAAPALSYKSPQSRSVTPWSQSYQGAVKTKAENALDEQNLSKVVPAEAEFRQLIGDQPDGMLARFLQDQLKLMCWHRLKTDSNLVFGAQLNLKRVVDGLRGVLQPSEPGWGEEICVALLDDNARPVILSRDKFAANWKRPFVATEVGDALPHWEVAAYLVNPAQLSQAAQTAKLTLGLLIAVLLVAIGIGSVLIVRSLDVELKLARQKTDFVSNVSHELKTPLTSIRMFSELLADGRVTEPAKQQSYLQIISAEAGRLTRLINNVLDFSRMERGEKKYNFQTCDLTELVRSTAETFRPHLEASGFTLACELPAGPAPVRGDSDALSQIIVNLLSNAEKYSNGAREIGLELAVKSAPLPHAEIKVLDRGPGVPRGSEEKIFEKFYRAHDGLSSGIPGSGLGLTIARQIARAHGGEVTCEARDGGGSCFVLRLPVQAGGPASS